MIKIELESLMKFEEVFFKNSMNVYDWGMENENIRDVFEIIDYEAVAIVI